METIVAILIAVVGFIFVVVEVITKTKDIVESVRVVSDHLSKKEARENEKITLILFGDKLVLTLPYQPRRRDLNRAEVAGVIGMYSGGARYNIPELFAIYLPGGELDRALTGNSTELWIPAPDAEIARFQECIDGQETVMADVEKRRQAAQQKAKAPQKADA